MFILNINVVMMFLIIFLIHKGFSVLPRAIRDQGSSSSAPPSTDEESNYCIYEL